MILNTNIPPTTEQLTLQKECKQCRMSITPHKGYFLHTQPALIQSPVLREFRCVTNYKNAVYFTHTYK